MLTLTLTRNPNTNTYTILSAANQPRCAIYYAESIIEILGLLAYRNVIGPANMC